MSVEEWQAVARAMAAHDVVDPGGSEHWADHMFGARARQFIAAFDAITEYRGDPMKEFGDAVTRNTQADEIERVARRMARSDARDNHIPTGEIDGLVDDAWRDYRDAAAEHLNQLRSGNA